jgi:hypothetical protein
MTDHESYSRFGWLGMSESGNASVFMPVQLCFGMCSKNINPKLISTANRFAAP